MRLTPKEIDRLTVFTLAELARRRHGRGLKLNHPEAMAIICDEIFEEARAGRDYDEVVAHACSVLRHEDVLDGVAEMLTVVQVDAMFPDGTRLVTVRNPIRTTQHDESTALAPGALIPGSDPVEIHAGLPVIELPITNDGDVPVQLTAHMHVFEANPMLRFDRRRSFGMRPDVPAGMAVRIEPGETRQVRLVPIGGARVVRGFAGMVDGPLDEADVDTLLARAIERGYRHEPLE